MSSPTAPGRAIVTGTVVRGDAASDASSSGAGLPGVTVRVVRTGQLTQTDGAGNFTLAGVPAGDQEFQFSRSDIDARATIPVTGGATVAVTAAISRRSTVVISPRGNGNPQLPAQTQTQTPLPGTPTPGTPTPIGNAVEQIEGIVTANNGGSLTIFDQRLGSVVVTLTPTTIIRKGQTAVPPAEILVGMRVHVKALFESTGTYTAVEIIVQNENAATATSTPTTTMTPTAALTNTPTTTRTATRTVTPSATPTGATP